MPKDNGGFELIEYAAGEQLKKVIPIGNLARQDALIREQLKSSQNQGVIMTVLNPAQDEDINQIFRQAKWANEEQRARYVNAYQKAECVNSEYAMEYIKRRINANTAGDEGWLILASHNALNHTSFTTNVQPQQARRWLGGNRNDTGPLS